MTSRCVLDHWFEKPWTIVVQRYQGGSEKLGKAYVRCPRYINPSYLPIVEYVTSHTQCRIRSGTTFDTFAKFNGRLHLLVETCKKRALPSFSAQTKLVQGMIFINELLRLMYQKLVENSVCRNNPNFFNYLFN